MKGHLFGIKFYTRKDGTIVRAGGVAKSLKNATPFQEEQMKRFAATAKYVAEKIPADGKFETLQKRRDAIGAALKGVYTEAPVRVPLHATPEYIKRLTDNGRRKTSPAVARDRMGVGEVTADTLRNLGVKIPTIAAGE